MLFDKIEIKNLKSKNRIVMPPMCQYQAKDGIANDWHFIHYVSRAIGQVGIIIIEASAIEPRGRISMNDLGIWDDKHIEPLAKIVAACKNHGANVGIQLAHAGRKSKVTDEAIVAPSSLAFSGQYALPHELAEAEIIEITEKFGSAALRAKKAGFDFVEVHGAHGYLINEFLSPISNLRNDKYGIDKSLFLKEVLEKVKASFPSEAPIFLRVSGEEYHPGGNHPETLASQLKPLTNLFDVLHVSSGGTIEKEHYDVFPGYQLEYAAKLKKLLGKPTIAVGRLEDPGLAEKALMENKADMIAIGRGLLSDPHWPLHAAQNLNIEIDWPESYLRAKGL
ncbi:MAG: oxidoreductase [Bacteroidales bacterium]|nr:oxidoreductase [Bacteroidales bacterium]